MELKGHSMDIPWNSMEIHGELHRDPRKFMEFHEIPWNSMEVFSPG